VASADVAARLNLDDELDFADRRRGEGCIGRDVAKLLKPYGPRTRDVRIGDRKLKGYRAVDYAEVIARYLPADADSHGGATNATNATSKPQSQANVADVADVADGWGPDGVFRGYDPGAPTDLPPRGELERLRTVPDDHELRLDEIDELGRLEIERRPNGGSA
jgi:hypothetical protein